MTARTFRCGRAPLIALAAALAALAGPVAGATLTVRGRDSAAIRACIERSRAGDTIVVPAGVYAVTEAVAPRSGTRFVGAAAGKTVLRYSGTKPGAVMVLDGCRDVVISDLTVDGANSGLVLQGIYARNSRRLTISRVAVRDLARGAQGFVHGIHFNGDSPTRDHGVTDSTIADCAITDIGVGAEFGCGIRLSWGSSRNRVVGCRIDRTGRGGIFADNGSSDLVIARNVVEHSGGEMLGIEVWGGCDRCVIEDNRIDHWLSIGGCDWCAARRNVVSAKDGTFGFIGIEAIGSHCVITDNTVDDGQVIGLSVSNVPAHRYVYYARNVFRACCQWGAQFQGETDGIAYQYLYRCRFEGTTGRGKVPYPGDAGDGFRVNGNTRHLVFDECSFSANARSGFQVTTPDVGAWLFRRCRFEHNKGPAAAWPTIEGPVAWSGCVSRGNADDRLPAGRAFGAAEPVAAFDAPAVIRPGETVRFTSRASAAAGSSAASLWDFGDGPPGGGDAATHVYRRPGTYRVALIVWDRAGRGARAERVVRVVTGAERTRRPATRHYARSTKVTPGAPRGPGRFPITGLYISPPASGQGHFYDFFRACGYNYLEFCEGGFGQRPDRLAAYHTDFAGAVDAAQRKGFKVWVLLLAGMKQWKGPAEAGSAGTFSALDAGLLAERLSYLREAVRALRGADGFVFFAGDPGGDPEGRSSVHDCTRFARAVQRIVREEAPKAGFAVNLWAIAEWSGFPSPFSLEFWRKQVELSRAVAEEPDLLGPDCGVAFSLDSYYRSLTLACYADAGVKPERYPQQADVRRLRERGVQPILGWPYFLVDEVDDGFITPNNVASGGQSQAETRYIRAIVAQGHRIGLDGLVANASYVAAEALNVYAFGRMCGAPGLTPEAALDEWAGLVADDRTRGSLARVLRFIENHSNWQNSLPAAYRLKDLDCGDITSAAVALERLAGVVPREGPSIPLPELPARYLERLKGRLEAIAAGHIGGVAPIVRTPKGAR